MLPEVVTKIPGPKSFELAERLKKVESPGLTYLAEDFPVFWEKTSGANIWDVDGNRYLDLNSAFGVCGIGHSNKRVQKAIAAQTSKIIHGMGDVHPPKVKVQFMEKLASILPNSLNKMILSCNGSDACESALKTAQVYTGKNVVIAFNGGYHGLGYGALDLTYKKHFRDPFEERLTTFTKHVAYPDVYRDGEEFAANNSLKEVKEQFTQNKGKVAAVIVEALQSRGGVRFLPKGYLKKLQSLCHENNALLIMDEIYTGFARTGKMFAFEHDGIVPDIICLGKTIGGGLPFSVCATSEKIMNAWGNSNGEAIHTSTFLGNPVACAAGIEVVNCLLEENFAARVQDFGTYMQKCLKALNHPFIGDVRGKGLMIGVELVKNKSTKVPNTELANKVLAGMLQKGFIVLTCGHHGNVLSLSPPFVITKQEIDFAVKCLAECLG